MAAEMATLEEKRSQYARLEAAEVLLEWLDQEGLLFPNPEGEREFHLIGSVELFTELFPDDEEGPTLLGVRTNSLVAGAFARLATDEARQFFLDRAAYFADLAARKLAEIQEGAGPDAEGSHAS